MFTQVELFSRRYYENGTPPYITYSSNAKNGQFSAARFYLSFLIVYLF